MTIDKMRERVEAYDEVVARLQDARVLFDLPTPKIDTMINAACDAVVPGAKWNFGLRMRLRAALTAAVAAAVTEAEGQRAAMETTPE